MVTFAQAQERAEEWVNGDVPSYQHREVRVREFELGFVVWAEDRAEGPRSDGGAQRLVLARDSGEATLWPALPVGEVIRRYEEEYGRSAAVEDAVPAPPARVDLNQTSFLLTPPEWLQEAADRLGIPDRRADSPAGGGGTATPSSPAPAASPEPPAPPTPSVSVASSATGATPWTGTDTTSVDAGEDRSVPLPATVFAPPLSEEVPRSRDAFDGGLAPTYGYPQGASGPSYGYPQGASSPPGRALASNAGEIADAATSKAPPPRGARGASAPPPPGAPGTPGARPGVAPPPAGPGPTPGPAGGYVPTQFVSQLREGDFDEGADGVNPPGAPGAAPGVPGVPGVPNSPGHSPGGAAPGGVDHAATMFADPGRPGGPGVPQPPAAPGAPGAAQVPGAPKPPGAPGAPHRPGVPPSPGGTPPGGVHQAATMFADPGQGGPGNVPRPPGPPGAPQPPGAPGGPSAPAAPGVPGAPDAVHRAETMLAGPPVGGPRMPPPPPAAGVPGAPGAPGAPGFPGTPPPAPQPPMPPVGRPAPGMAPPGMAPPGFPPPAPGLSVPPPPVAPGLAPQPPAYGYPPPGQPTVGPGYQAVLRYRAPDGSEQQVIRRSAPGTPHPEWQIFHELRAMNIPPDQVLELHTELESCELPGAYCARMIREQWPNARITSIAPYGTDHASRQQGMAQLLAHQGELHQVADGPARPAPVRTPLPPVQPTPPVPPEGIAQEMAAAFGPGVFRFDQAAVSRQGVPPIVAHTLVVAGLPTDMGPFFWAQAQPGRPVPTLAELAQERGVRPASDAGSYLVMGSDFGRAICVQYGTANIVAVPVEAGPGGAPVAPQFVNTGLPEFARCLALLGRMWRLRYGLNQEQAGRWTVDFQAQLASLDPVALGSPESWWSVLLEQMWDGLL
ncbi:SUKH-4 family immunity protein [Streptomyces sp. NBC_01538]|uniref:SUKH-4 family immunity protein n=1 Tax=Streptomyces sp. NBC_01538 TaxID=2903897 RepID=UPI00386F5522